MLLNERGLDDEVDVAVEGGAVVLRAVSKASWVRDVRASWKSLAPLFVALAPPFSDTMRGVANEFTAIIEDGGDGWYWAHSPEVPGANGQGRTPPEALDDLAAAIELVLAQLRDEAARSMSPSAVKDVVRVG